MRRAVHIWMPGTYTRDDALTSWLKTVLRQHPGGRLVGNSVLVGSRAVATWKGSPESSTTSDALDPRYLQWVEALKKSNRAKNAYETASRIGDPKRDDLKDKYERLDAEQRRLSAEGWETSSTNIIGGRK